MAEIIPFETRAQRAARVPAPVIAPVQDIYAITYEPCLAAVRTLVAELKATNYWTNDCEPAMIKVVEDLRSLCSIMAKGQVPNDGTPHAQ